MRELGVNLALFNSIGLVLEVAGCRVRGLMGICMKKVFNLSEVLDQHDWKADLFQSLEVVMFEKSGIFLAVQRFLLF